MRVMLVFVQGLGTDGRYDMRNNWNDDMNVTRGAARSRLDMQHGFVRHIVSPARCFPEIMKLLAIVANSDLSQQLDCKLLPRQMLNLFHRLLFPLPLRYMC